MSKNHKTNYGGKIWTLDYITANQLAIVEKKNTKLLTNYMVKERLFHEFIQICTKHRKRDKCSVYLVLQEITFAAAKIRRQQNAAMLVS